MFLSSAFLKLDMQQSHCFAETLNGQLGRFVDVVRRVERFTQSIGYVSCLNDKILSSTLGRCYRIAT